MPQSIATPPNRQGRIDVAEILRRLDIAAEFQSLGGRLAGNPNSDGWVPCHAMGREDRSPSAAINIKTGYYKDHGGTGESLSFWDFSARYDSRFSDWKDARQYYADKTGVSLPRRNGKRSKSVNGHPGEEVAPKVLATIGAFPVGMISSRDAWLSDRPPINCESLGALGAGYSAYRGVPAICIPVWQASDLTKDWGRVYIHLPVHLGGVETPSPGLPVGTGKDIYYESKVNRKLPDVKKKENGIIIPEADRQRILAGSEGVDAVVSFEGITDLLAAIARRPADSKALILANACGCAEKLTTDAAKLFAPKGIIFGDADTPGQKGAVERTQAVANAGIEAVCPQLPYPIKEKKGKDVRDFFAEGRTFADLMDLAAAAEPVKANPKAGPDGGGDERPSHLAIARIYIDQNRVDGVPIYCRHGNKKNRENYRWNGQVYERASTEDMASDIARLMEDLGLNPTKASVASVLSLTEGEIRAPRHVADDAPVFWRATPPSDFPADADLSTALPTRTRLIIPQAGKPPTEWRSWTRNARLFSTSCYPFDFEEDAHSNFVPPQAPQWMQFLNEVFGGEQDQITTLQAWFGYLLSGRTNQQKLLMLSGPPRSGKGTIAHQMARVVGAARTASTSLAALAGQFGYATLKGKQLAILADERRLGKQATNEVLPKILSVTGEDAVPVDQKYQEPVSVQLGTRLAILSNDISPLIDECPALTSRMILLRSRESFIGRENINLKTELDAEIPGILWWAMEGLDWIISGYRLQNPASTADDLAGLQDDGNPLAEFFRERIEKAPGEWLAASEIRAAAREWAEDQGIEILANIGTRKVGHLLASAIPSARRTQRRSDGSRTWGYEGIRLRGSSFRVVTE